jgi:hypothetical protein
LLVIYNIHRQAKEDHAYFKRKINKYHIADFQLNLSYESWGVVFIKIMLIRLLTFFKDILENLLS